MEDKLISIIIPVYNIEEYLRRSIESVQKQSYRKLQIILVDDGSTDQSGAICDEYAAGDDRIQVIHKKNGGLSDARNAGLTVATGEYIGYVDGDDWIDEGMYREMYDACMQYQADIAVCRYKTVSGDNVTDGSSHAVIPLTQEETLDIYVNERPQYIIFNSVWSKLFKRELVKDLIFPVGKNSEDILYTTHAFCRMQRCVYLDTAYYNYVTAREGSIMNAKSGRRSIEDEIPFLRQQIELLHEYGHPDVADHAAYMFYRRIIFYFLQFYQIRENKIYAKDIIRQLHEDRNRIHVLYQLPFVKKGDKVRMRLVQVWPVAYYYTVKLYDGVIIPLRCMLRNRKHNK